MITDEMPLLTVRRRFPRPEPEHLDAFADVSTSFVADALGGRGALDFRIKPLLPRHATFYGVAVTCYTGPGDILAIWAAIDISQAGDVIVVSTDGHQGTAYAGDNLLGICRNKRISGFVTDGCVRDLSDLDEIGVPVFATGTTPNSPTEAGPGDAGLRVIIGGVSVDSGDIIIGDLDGVVVVPLTRVPEILAALERVRALESEVSAKVKDGMILPPNRQALLRSSKVKEVD